MISNNKNTKKTKYSSCEWIKILIIDITRWINIFDFLFQISLYISPHPLAAVNIKQWAIPYNGIILNGQQKILITIAKFINAILTVHTDCTKSKYKLISGALWNIHFRSLFYKTGIYFRLLSSCNKI